MPNMKMGMDREEISVLHHQMSEVIVLEDDGQEAVQDEQDDQHVQQEEQLVDDHDGCDMEDKFAEGKVKHKELNNQLSFRLAETKLSNEPDSCTTAPAINRGREGRPLTINNIFSETKYSDSVKVAGQGDPVQDDHGPQHHHHPQEDVIYKLTDLLVGAVQAEHGAAGGGEAVQDGQGQHDEDRVRACEDGAREDGAREDEAGEDGAREDGAREHGAREHGGRDDGVHDDDERRDGVRGDGVRDDRASGLWKQSGSQEVRKKRSARKRLRGIEAGVVQSKITSFIKRFPNLRKTSPSKKLTFGTDQGPINKNYFNFKRKSDQMESPSKQPERINRFGLETN